MFGKVNTFNVLLGRDIIVLPSQVLFSSSKSNQGVAKLVHKKKSFPHVGELVNDIIYMNSCEERLTYSIKPTFK